MSVERCKHELLPGHCLDCAPVPEGLTPRVVTTDGGAVFHRSTGCAALSDGQRKARRWGKDVHDPRNIALSEALSQGRGACLVCFPAYRPADGAKPCTVLVDGEWRRGLLGRWERAADGRWRGHVTYMADGERVTAVKDQSELRKHDA